MEHSQPSNLLITSEAISTFHRSTLKTGICEVCLERYNSPEDLLAYCTTCATLVHQSCYGGDILQLVLKEWRCEKCRYLSRHKNECVHCCFCPQDEIGPIKCMKVSDASGQFWAHVQCVNWIPEIYFLNHE